MRLLKPLALASFFLLFSFSAGAADYYWTKYLQPNVGEKFTNPTTACRTLYPPSRDWGSSFLLGADAVSGSCRVGCFSGWCDVGTVFKHSTAEPVPGGQSCQRDGTPLTGFGFITNSSGQCVDYINADPPSQCKSLSGRTGPTTLQVTFDSDGNPITPPPISVQGCEAQAYGVAHCKMAPVRKFPTGGSIQSSINKCVVDVKFTGNTSGQGSPVILPPGSPNDGVCDPSSPCPPPQDPPIQNDHKPCVYVLDGEGRRVCSSNKWNANPGQTSCGTVNGQFQCIGKAPTSNGIVIDTTVTDTQNADGTTTSVKDDKITHTTCTGAYSCNTTVTNNKTSIIKDMGGNTIGQSSQCTGPHCSKDGQDDADGDDLKDCIGIGCGLGSGSGPGTGIGDEGEGGEFSGPENSEVAGFGETTSAFMSRLNSAPVVAAAQNLSFIGGGSCQFGSFTVPILGTLSFQPVCAWAAEWLAPLRAIMLAVWALLAVRVFLEA